MSFTPSPQIGVWCVPLPAQPAPGALRDFLTPEDLSELGRIRDAAERWRRTVGRVCLRVLVGRACHTAPWALDLVRTPAGKPLVTTNALHFNLSHSGRWCLLALSRQVPVGIDVEERRRLEDWPALAAATFTPAEQLALRRGDLSDFYRCWVRREAVLKALGTGLSDDPQAAVIRGEPPSRWQGAEKKGCLLEWKPDDEHVAALAWVGAATQPTIRELSVPELLDRGRRREA